MKPRDPLPKELFFRAARDGENYTRPGDTSKVSPDPAELTLKDEAVVVGRYTLVEELEVQNKMTLDVRSLSKPTGKKAK